MVPNILGDTLHPKSFITYSSCLQKLFVFMYRDSSKCRLSLHNRAILLELPESCINGSLHLHFQDTADQTSAEGKKKFSPSEWVMRYNISFVRGFCPKSSKNPKLLGWIKIKKKKNLYKPLGSLQKKKVTFLVHYWTLKYTEQPLFYVAVFLSVMS